MASSRAEKVYLPEKDVDSEFAEMCARLADHQLRDGDERPRLSLGNGEAVELPASMAQILGDVAAAMLEGRAVTVAPTDTVLSTQAAADLLGISRLTLIRLLDSGEIPFDRPRRHRRLLLTDVLKYRDQQRARADAALTDIVEDTQRFGGYDIDPGEALKAARQIRKTA